MSHVLAAAERNINSVVGQIINKNEEMIRSVRFQHFLEDKIKKAQSKVFDWAFYYYVWDFGTLIFG